MSEHEKLSIIVMKTRQQRTNTYVNYASLVNDIVYVKIKNSPATWTTGKYPFTGLLFIIDRTVNLV